MIFNFSKKRKLPKKILVLSSLPFDKDSFTEAYSSNNSDFIASLKSLYNIYKLDSLWKYFQPYANQLNKTFNLISKYGGCVIKNFNLNDLKRISEYDIVIILAHHSDISDEIEIGNKMISTGEFVNNIPHNCKIILDITSCYSSHLLPWIKAHIPQSKIIGINCPTSLTTRLKVITCSILLMAEKGIENYLKAFVLAWNESGVANTYVIDNDIKLGSKFKSTLYAPLEVCKGEDFVVSIFLHKTENDDEIEIFARNIDPELSKRNQLYLKSKLNKGDLIEFQIYFNTQQYKGILVDEYSKEIYWDNNIESVEFIFTTNEEFNKSSFIGKIKVAINKAPVGDMIFKIRIVDEMTQIGVSPCCPITFEPYDKQDDMEKHHNQLLHIFSLKLKELESKSNCKLSEEEVLKEMEICQKCIDLIRSKPKEKKNTPLKVFVSSTSDMHLFRNIIKEQIESCEMYADMYERWGQSEFYPRDMCCSHVLQSDIFVCVLGARYGFIEPLWDKSMTEIEYRVASNAGIPMLIYIISDYKQKMQQLEGDDRATSTRQEAFIEELKSKRLVCLFKNEFSLQLQSNTELMTLKSRLMI